MARRKYKEPDIFEFISGIIVLSIVGFIFKFKEWVENNSIWPWVIIFFVAVIFIIILIFLFRRRNKKVLDFSDDKKIKYMLRGMSPYEFEEEISKMFNRFGYKAKPVGRSHDGGIDVVAKRGGKTFLVQCKKHITSRVGVEKVREFYGVVSRKQANGGFLITTNEFTQEALDEFRKDKKIKLIDGQKLVVFYKKSMEGIPKF